MREKIRQALRAIAEAFEELLEENRRLRGAEARPAAPQPRLATAATDTQLCVHCGNMTRRTGACFTCETCGESGGCG